MKLANAFSLQMLPLGGFFNIMTKRISVAEAKEVLGSGSVESYIGHADTARILSGILGMEIPARRERMTVESGEVFLVAQYEGSRLPEGATTLPEGAKITFWMMEANAQYDD